MIKNRTAISSGQGIKLFIVMILTLALLVGCNTSSPEDDSTGGSEPVSEETGTEEESFDFSYSEGIDENGFVEGVVAKDYTGDFEYLDLEIPSEAHEVSEEDIQAQIETMLVSFSVPEDVTDRAVEDGDLVNIDYVGSVDGVEFEGGSTGGMGTEVTAGSLDYIDDFLVQIIGHTPGETIDVEVTFPENYHEESLQGADAVFVTTINHIVENKLPEITDEFVEESLSEQFSWTTVEEMEAGIEEDLHNYNVQQFVVDYLLYDVEVSEIPEHMLEYQENSMIAYYQYNAEMYGMGLEEFLSLGMGVSSVEEAIEEGKETNILNAEYLLAVQAVAEDADFSVNEEDVTEYFETYMGTSDYSLYEEEYGLPYLKQMVLQQAVIDLMAESAELL